MISKWKLKAIVQKCISFMPKREKVNYLFQKHVTHGVELFDEHFGFKVDHARDHIDYFRKYGNTGPEMKIMELGTGWYPIIPMFMFLTKTGKVTSVDIQSWMNRDRQIITINKFFEWYNKGWLDDKFKDIDKDRLQQLEHVHKNPDTYSMEDINELIGLTTLLKDARNTGLEERSMDMICSNNTFEHIEGDVLKGILIEYKRIIKSGGVMSHFIDMSDHFAHFDKKITVYNFLKYSTKSWSMIDNKIQPQNRFRHKDYLKMYKELDIPVTEEKIEDGNSETLALVNVHPEFKDYSQEQLAITHAYLVSKMN